MNKRKISLAVGIIVFLIALAILVSSGNTSHNTQTVPKITIPDKVTLMVQIPDSGTMIETTPKDLDENNAIVLTQNSIVNGGSSNLFVTQVISREYFAKTTILQPGQAMDINGLTKSVWLNQVEYA